MKDQIEEIYLRYKKDTISFADMHIELLKLQSVSNCKLEPFLHEIFTSYDLLILNTVEGVNNIN